MEKYFETMKLDDATHIKVSVAYRKGGWNNFTSREEKRGVYVSFSPVKVTQRESYFTEEYMAFSGVKFLVKEMGRMSQAAIDSAERMIVPVLPDLIKLFEDRSEDAMLDLICDLIEHNKVPKLYVVCSDRIWNDNLVCVCKNWEEAEMVEEKWKSFPDRMRVRIVKTEPTYIATWYRVSKEGSIVKVR